MMSTAPGQTIDETLAEQATLLAGEGAHAEQELVCAGWHDPTRLQAECAKHGITRQSFAEPKWGHTASYLLLQCAARGVDPDIVALERLLADAGCPFINWPYEHYGFYRFCDAVCETTDATIREWAVKVSQWAAQRQQAQGLIAQVFELLGGNLDLLERPSVQVVSRHNRGRCRRPSIKRISYVR